MIYVTEIEVPARARWGDVFSREVVLPSKIYRVRGVMANAVADFETLTVVEDGAGNPEEHRVELATDKMTYSQKLFTAVGFYGEKESETQTLTRPHTMQCGLVSAAVNEHFVLADLPVRLTGRTHNSHWNKNLLTFGEKMLVRPGSTLRLTYQERLFSPFKADALLGGNPAYRVKFYIDYASK